MDHIDHPSSLSSSSSDGLPGGGGGPVNGGPVGGGGGGGCCAGCCCHILTSAAINGSLLLAARGWAGLGPGKVSQNLAERAHEEAGVVMSTPRNSENSEGAWAQTSDDL